MSPSVYIAKHIVHGSEKYEEFQMCFFSDWHIIKRSFKCLSVYINIILTIIFNNYI